MSQRVGALLVITGLSTALLLGGSLFVIAGLMAMVGGGIVLAAGMESGLVEERVDSGIPPEPIDAERRDLAA
jgi:hypothetical protein